MLREVCFYKPLKKAASDLLPTVSRADDEKKRTCLN